ncbi:NUDIX domain-containing protein [Microbacterium sp. KUDC0406]|uniref:NUDIX domain-containing protein n=1 Tax=Microbacterium sp. KUDC0406 TaxID=2909588 RepID=UPI001F1620E1|nr:NUDIX domain-containing protein [Microbacterium sp. KUDC0406]UJP11055.1 NUDIX domain-containing protein [Microbacterium sp. KUDC0406]
MSIDRSYIRVKAMLVAPNADGTRHLVSRNASSKENPEGYDRFVGGSVELGETHREAVIREVDEELGAEIRDLFFWEWSKISFGWTESSGTRSSRCTADDCIPSRLLKAERSRSPTGRWFRSSGVRSTTPSSPFRSTRPQRASGSAGLGAGV